MNFLKRIFNPNSPKINESAQRIRVTYDNLRLWPNFDKLFEEGKVKFDAEGRLRYLHGAPVDDLILIRVNKGGTPIYKESTEEWFDPESPNAKNFIWP